MSNNYPFKAKLIDSRYENLVYLIKVKDERDWQNIKSLEETGYYRIEALAPKRQDKVVVS